MAPQEPRPPDLQRRNHLGWGIASMQKDNREHGGANRA